MATDPIEARVAVVESGVRSLDTERERTRTRLHRLEKGQTAVRLLIREVESLATQIKELRGSVETIAQRAAERAIELAFAARDEQIEERRRSRKDYRLRLIGTGVALGGFVSSLIALIVTNT